MFQDAIRDTLSGLVGVTNVSDDILIYSSTLEEHHARLRATLQRLVDNGLTLHQNKCSFYTNSVEFFGYHFSEKGLKVDPKKREVIRTATDPQNSSEVRSFLGMANYCGNFIPNLASCPDKCRPPVGVNAHTDQAFKNVKNALLADATMAYFDQRRKTVLVVDASPVGLGAVLLQEKSK